jgi:hypothetical protein
MKGTYFADSRRELTDGSEVWVIYESEKNVSVEARGKQVCELIRDGNDAAVLGKTCLQQEVKQRKKTKEISHGSKSSAVCIKGMALVPSSQPKIYTRVSCHWTQYSEYDVGISWG